MGASKYGYIATQYNSKYNTFFCGVGWGIDSRALEDGFLLLWSNSFLFIFPLLPLISKILHRERPKCIMMTPVVASSTMVPCDPTPVFYSPKTSWSFRTTKFSTMVCLTSSWWHGEFSHRLFCQSFCSSGKQLKPIHQMVLKWDHFLCCFNDPGV